jgi:hypothetical protein
MSRLRQFGQKRFGQKQLGQKKSGQETAGTSVTISVFALAFLFTISTASCSRPAAVPGVVGAARNSQPDLPFNGEPASGNASGQYHPANQSASSDPASSVPFHDPHSLPPGTLIIVRLDKAISADATSAVDSFQATVEEPVIVEGTMLVPKGAAVMGRIESARASAMKRGHGYIQLTLASLAVAGQDFHLETASLFARLNPGSNKPQNASVGNGIRLDQGRTLTFRLTRPVEMATNHPVPSQALAKPNF